MYLRKRVVANVVNAADETIQADPTRCVFPASETAAAAVPATEDAAEPSYANAAEFGSAITVPCNY